MAFIRCITHTILCHFVYFIAKASCLTEKLVSSSLVSQNYCFYSISISLSLFLFFSYFFFFVLCTPSTGCPSPPTTTLPVHIILVRSFSYTRKIINYCILKIGEEKESTIFFFCFFFVRFLPCSEQ